MNAWEEEILISLAWHVRVLSVEQLARTWWSGLATGKRLASNFVKARSETGWLQVREVLSRKPTSLAEPLETWHLKAPVPDFAELSRLLHRRARTPARKFRVVMASRKCRELFGVVGAAHCPKLTQLTHELFVAEVFLRYLQNGLNVYSGEWVSEDHFPSPWPIRVRPDRLIRDPEGNIIRAIEYGGAYGVRRLSSLYGALKGISLPCEGWWKPGEKERIT